MIRLYQRVASVLLLLFPLLIHAQELPYAWLRSIQPVDVVVNDAFPVYTVHDVAMDAAGNVYTTGFFKATCDFDPSAGQSTLTATGDQDIFVAKYDAQGNLLFVKRVQATGTGAGFRLAVTSTGKIIVAGKFTTDVTFDPGGAAEFHASAGQNDIFIARFDGATGAFEQAVTLGNTGDDQPNRLEVYNDEIYLFGYFQSSIDVDPSAGTFNLIGTGTGSTAFMVKLPDLNSFSWATVVGSGYSISNIDVNSNGLFMTGTFTGTVDFDPSAANVANLTATGTQDVYFSKLNLNGDFQWAKRFGGVGPETVFDIAAASSGNIYVTGTFQGTSDMDPGNGTVNIVSNNQSVDAFLSKFDGNGNFLWSKGWGGSAYDDGTTVIVLSSDRAIVSGNFMSKNMDLDPGIGATVVSSKGSYDVSISLFASDGSFLHGFAYGSPSPTNFDGGYLKSNGTDTFIIHGTYSDETDFDPSADANGLKSDFQENYISYYGLLATLPAAQPTTLTLGPTSSSVTGSFAAATGNPGYIVTRKLGSAATGAPKDGTSYTVGDRVGDAVVAFAGTGTNFTDNNLAASKTYFYSVYASNNKNGYVNYRITSPLTASTATTAVSYNRTTDSLALVQLYNATNGAAWTTRTNWVNGSSPISAWYGVTFNNTTKRVTQINLPSNNLTGSVVSSIGNLTALTRVDFSNNDISGAIPTELLEIPVLAHLNLHNNNFEGELPAALSASTALTYLDLSLNELTGSIMDLSALTGLTNLLLYGNSLLGSIPTSIGSLTNLVAVDLNGNQLTGSIPSSLGSLSALNYLYLQSNALTGSIPSELGSLNAVINFNLSDNQLTGSIPSSLGSLASVNDLQLQNNELTGTIPATLNSATNLTNLDVGGNLLSGAVPSLSALTNLSGLSIANNQITGLPNLSGLPSLSNLYVQDNYLTFEDLEPNVSKLTVWSPQASVGQRDTILYVNGQSVSIPISVGGTANLFQWYKNDVAVGGQTTGTLSFTATPLSPGSYQLKVTNSIVTGLTIVSEAIYINVKAESLLQWADAGDLTNDGKDASLYGGVWGDFDNDGYDDIMTLGTSDVYPGYLYHNNRNGTFTRLTDAIGYEDGRSAEWGDYNNDGYADLFVPDASFAPNSSDFVAAVYKNNRDGSFTKISLNQSAVSGAWIDYDFDGDLDLSIEGGSGVTTQIFRNDGNDTFTPFSLLNEGTQWSAIWVDINNDSRLDYFMPSTNADANIFRIFSNDGYGELNDIGFAAGLTSAPRGATWGDIDNDGDMDVFISTQGSTDQSRFYINDGNGNFSLLLGSAALGETIRNGRGAALVDFNNDGFLDLITNQNLVDIKGPSIYLNNGNLTFTRLSNQTFKSQDLNTGFSVSDYDNDGDLDLFTVSTIGFTNGLYKNLTSGKHWIKIKLKGRESNAMAIGARISVYAGGMGRHTQLVTANGHATQHTLYNHFGLGNTTTIDSIKVTWPNGRLQYFFGLAVDQLHELTEPLNPQYEGDAQLQLVKQISNVGESDLNGLSTYISTDATNNTYMAGHFYGTIDVDPGPGQMLFSATGNGSDGDAFLVKLNTDGVLVWAKQFSVGSDANNDLFLHAVEIDKDNNIILGGEFTGTIDFDPDAGVSNLMSPAGAANVFFGKFSGSDGKLTWIKAIETSGTNVWAEVDDIETDGNGNIIVAGQLSAASTGSIDLDPSASTQILNLEGLTDAFLVEYDANGNYTWHSDVASVNDDNGGGVAIDGTGNVYFSSHTNNGGSSTLNIMKFTPAGALSWLADSPNIYGEDDSRLIIQGTTLWVSGNYSGNVTLEGVTGSAALTGYQQGTNTYLMKLDLNGALQWAKGFMSSGYATIHSTEAIASGDVIISGFFEGHMDLDPGINNYEYYLPGQTTAVIKLSAAGDFIWGFAIPNSYGVHEVLSNGDMVLALGVQGTADVDPSQTVNAVTSAGTENVVWLKFGITTSVSAADQLLLERLYDETGGPNWTNKSGWKVGTVSNAWFGVTVVNNKVTEIKLPNNNLVGDVPSDLYTLNELQIVNFSDNFLNSVPDLSSVTSITSYDVSKNKLDFASLEPNMSVANFQYLNQKPIGEADTVLIDVGQPYDLSFFVGGSANSYTWKRNGSAIAGATESNYLIPSVNKASMGNFVNEITSTLVPNLTLQTEPKSVFAVTKVSGQLLYEGVGVTNGIMRLLRITSEGGFDSLHNVNVNSDGTYLIEKVILDKYQLLGWADTTQTTYKRALPTYYDNKLYWEEADTLVIEGELSNLDIESYLKPTDTPAGTGLIDGYVVEDDGSPGGRSQAPKRVAGAGASVRRVEGSGRGKEEILTLVAYNFTNENGEFAFEQLDPGTYRINIQYPGFPMDESSYIDITIGSGLEGHKRAEASVEEGKIVVRQLIITSVWAEEGYKIDVFPNPTSSFINLKFPAEVISREIKLIDVKGSTLQQVPVTGIETQIDVRAFKPGTYFIRVDENGRNVKTLRVQVKQ